MGGKKSWESETSGDEEGGYSTFVHETVEDEDDNGNGEEPPPAS